LFLHGGWGWLARSRGLALDNILEYEIVTADGKVVIASESSNPDLFWGCRGAAPNFGIVTSLVCKIFEEPNMYAGICAYPISHARKLAKYIRDIHDNHHITSLLQFIVGPKGPTCLFMFHCVGTDEECLNAEKHLYSEVGQPLTPNEIKKVTQLELQLIIAPKLAGLPWHLYHAYWSSTYVDDIPEKLMDDFVTIVEDWINGKSKDMPATFFVVESWGGKISAVPEMDSAYAGRKQNYLVGVLGGWFNPELNQENTNWVKSTVSAFKEKHAEHCAKYTYLNYANDADLRDQSLHQMMGEEKVKKLKALKRVWDPNNVFHNNANISPL